MFRQILDSAQVGPILQLVQMFDDLRFKMWLIGIEIGKHGFDLYANDA